MSDQMQTQQTPPEERADNTPDIRPSQGGLMKLFSRVTLTQLSLVVLAAVFVWQWLDAKSELDRTQLEVARRLSEVEASNKASQILVAQNQELVRELGGKLGLLETRYAETKNQRAALEELYRDMSSNRDQTALAEVEQMLLVAVQQLQLSANVKAALIAVQQAETRLQRLDRPAFAGLRKRIAQDIDRLRALPDIDTPAINARLEGMITKVDSMLLAQDARLQPVQPPAPMVGPHEGAWKRFLRELWQDAGGLVRIENTESKELPLLSPTQSFFLRENLKLRLLSARMALLARDEPGFRRELKMSQDWLKRYFDAGSEDVAQALAAMQKLEKTSIVAELPDIRGSLDMVRNYRQTRERGMQ
ncbi:MAG: uroporphyrinogen-III C-methyltransferase [Gammaproteobacteria bacterium]|nr:uroporphyrinogen-III C-methyltransferase [Gammaproteobacteria bacterium]MBU1775920.1 uroporphyrinogen-III C-methyltransferase [Gammaproteobacteria bacterium]MBU1968151.1 uroporphyrinogen-III C-methyltransferase [Gammaproteobacteria bacterium]